MTNTQIHANVTFFAFILLHFFSFSDQKVSYLYEFLIRTKRKHKNSESWTMHRVLYIYIYILLFWTMNFTKQTNKRWKINLWFYRLKNIRLLFECFVCLFSDGDYWNEYVWVFMFVKETFAKVLQIKHINIKILHSTFRYKKNNVCCQTISKYLFVNNV